MDGRLCTAQLAKSVWPLPVVLATNGVDSVAVQ